MGLLATDTHGLLDKFAHQTPSEESYTALLEGENDSLLLMHKGHCTGPCLQVLKQLADLLLAPPADPFAPEVVAVAPSPKVHHRTCPPLSVLPATKCEGEPDVPGTIATSGCTQRSGRFTRSQSSCV